ncbi:lipid A deacylase LpxR family protein [Pelagicoccus sp. SDUM812002]|uniref:lipid A deacylase LpxR family protein n=1 Tax=Pelagicoccus sp. SDUM812002 TaxID=3041266 RepID=UPI00280F818F|nr:lipid A deacylase LpxR family protein [Pelagicoccus sp. SDUM812002]MDQ8186197.1 lipid A deacylase LpxR family protein [Pelagicoccus sp. SDUM812002]
MKSKESFKRATICTGVAICLIAQTAAQNAENKAVTFGIAIENDSFSGTDQNYTNGTKLSWDFAKAETYEDIPHLPKWAKSVSKLRKERPTPYTFGATISLGQKIFTPSNKEATELLVDERPYAGWTYLSLALRETKKNHTDTFEITAGVVGPDSYAEDIQNWVHEKIGSQEALGWDNQLKNEIGGILTWQRDTRLIELPNDSTGWGTDFNTSFGASVGNIYTHALLGANLRFGYNRQAAISSPRIRPANTGVFPSGPEDARLQIGKPDFGFFLTLGAEGRYVGRNLFIEGNTWADSHGLELEHQVGDYYAGLTLLSRRWSLSYLYTVRSAEFPGQDEPHEFGGLTITRTF